jgi:uncharacterized membrane protein YjgN (DUF898 family)
MPIGGQSMNSSILQNKLVFDAVKSQIYRIWFINILLKIVTLGIYSFWGNTRLRKYLVSSFSLQGDRFAYTGTGMELFKGFLMALPIVIILYAPLIIWDQKVYPLVSLVFIPILIVVLAGLYAALRYRYSRMTWRGIRGNLLGSAWTYAFLVIGRTILNVLTLGYLIPHSDIKKSAYITEHSYLGTAKAEFQADPSPLIKINIITLLLLVPTLGISRLWYRAACNRHIYASTRIAGVQLENSQTAGMLFRLIFGNLAILLLTLGIGMPIIIHRNMNFFANTLSFIGEIDVDAIRQAEGDLTKSGEGIEGMLGSQDFGFGFG